MTDSVIKLTLPPRPHPADELFEVIWTLNKVERKGWYDLLLLRHDEGRTEAIARLRNRAEVLTGKLLHASPEDRVGAKCVAGIMKGRVCVRRREPLCDLDAIIREERPWG
jgi:hypothetical protein